MSPELKTQKEPPQGYRELQVKDYSYLDILDHTSEGIKIETEEGTYYMQIQETEIENGNSIHFGPTANRMFWVEQTADSVYQACFGTPREGLDEEPLFWVSVEALTQEPTS